MNSSIYSKLARRYDNAAWQASRRDVLKASLALGAGLLLSGPFTGFARADEAKAKPKRVIVIGAGFAGLTAAFELSAVGYDVMVFDARGRLGGRVVSFTDYVPGKVVEGGAEFIGSNHPAWLAYMQKFGLEKLKVSDHEDLAFPIMLGDQVLSDDEGAKVYEAMDKALRKMNTHALMTSAEEPWTIPQAQQWDAMSMADWLASVEADDKTKRLLRVMLESDAGQSLENMSYLAQLAMVRGGGVEKFWTTSEDWRCKGGNQQLAARLADGIGTDRIKLSTTVLRIDLSGSTGAVAVMTKDGKRYEADDIILAAPPSVWDKIAVSPSGTGNELFGMRTQMGLNHKFFAAVEKPFWLDEKKSPYGFAEGAINQTWEATDAQEGPGAVLAGFAGGPNADLLRNVAPDQQIAAGLAALQKLYPRLNEMTVNPRFLNWPSDPMAKASYSFPAPGQVTRLGPLLRKGLNGSFNEPRLHFAGEHTCYAFVGYMEGALQSGITVAKKLAARDNVVK